VHHGADGAERWVQGMLANLARPVQGGDTDQIRGVAAGECELAVANHYYYLRLAQSTDPAQQAIAAQVGFIVPNQADRGVHQNIGGAAMVRNSRNAENARRFLEFLASDRAQVLFASGNYEFPVVSGIAIDEALGALADARRDELNVSLLGEHNAAAVRIADRAGWR
jgi:iron(III) transport system substrate-binding protein